MTGTRKPNVVLFAPDSFRGDVLGHLGNAGALTPNVDAPVASDAVSYSNAFAQNPVCTPSRCSFVTYYRKVKAVNVTAGTVAANNNFNFTTVSGVLPITAVTAFPGPVTQMTSPLPTCRATWWTSRASTVQTGA